MIENSETKLGNSETKPGTFRDNLNSSKIVALIGTIFLFLYSIFMVINGILTPLNFTTTSSIIIYFYQVAYGVVCFIFACLLFKSLDLIKIGKTRVEYFWLIPLIFGGITTFGTFTIRIYSFIFDINTELWYFNPIGWILSYIYTLPAPLLIISAFLDLLPKYRKEVEIPKILSLIGAGITLIEVINVIYRSIVNSFFDRISTNEVIMAIIALIFAFTLLLIISRIDIKIPFNWWVVLIIGIVIIWTSVLGGVIIIAVVILILLKGSLKESDIRTLESEERELRERKKKLISIREGKLDWIITQYYDLGRDIQDIADHLGESMIAVRKYLDEIENRDKTENKEKTHRKDGIN